MEPEKRNPQECGALGGARTKEIHGPEHYSRIGKAGGKARALSADYAAIGAKGRAASNATRARKLAARDAEIRAWAEALGRIPTIAETARLWGFHRDTARATLKRLGLIS